MRAQVPAFRPAPSLQVFLIPGGGTCKAEESPGWARSQPNGHHNQALSTATANQSCPIGWRRDILIRRRLPAHRKAGRFASPTSRRPRASRRPCSGVGFVSLGGGPPRQRSRLPVVYGAPP